MYFAFKVMVFCTISLLCPPLQALTKITTQACDDTCPLYHTPQTHPGQNNGGARPGVGGGVVRGVSGVEL